MFRQMYHNINILSQINSNNFTQYGQLSLCLQSFDTLFGLQQRQLPCSNPTDAIPKRLLRVLWLGLENLKFLEAFLSMSQFFCKSSNWLGNYDFCR